MHRLTRRDALKVTAAAGAILVGSSLVSAAQDAGKGAADKAPDKSLVYGNNGRWEYHYGWWWWVMDFDADYINGWDIRRRCGNTGEHWVRSDAYKSKKRMGYCIHLPNRPPWYKVQLVGPVEMSGKYDKEAKQIVISKAEERAFDSDDTSKPGESRGTGDRGQ